MFVATEIQYDFKSMLAWSQAIIIFEVPPRSSFREEVKNIQNSLPYMLFEAYENAFRGIYYEQCREWHQCLGAWRHNPTI